jgi:hypothetical protein
MMDHSLCLTDENRATLTETRLRSELFTQGFKVSGIPPKALEKISDRALSQFSLTALVTIFQYTFSVLLTRLIVLT